MKILRFLSYTFIFFIILSCSSDDKITNEGENPENPIENVNITSYKNIYLSEYTNSTLNSYEQIINEELINNKFLSFTKETFLDGEIQSSIGGQNYFYENELLIKRILYDNENDVMHFTHSSDGNTIGIFWEMNNRNYRLIFISEHLGHFEKLYENEVQQRIIVAFDDNYNVIETRSENVQTGELGEPNLFTYTNDNLTGIQLRNGTNITISYTDIKNTLSFVNDNSFSKKLRRLMCAEAYNLNNAQNIMSLNHSKNISIDEANESQFIVSDNGFYAKKTTISELDGNIEGTNTITLEFTFD